MSPAKLSTYMTSEQVADLLQISVIRLAQDRMRGQGLPFFKIGRNVRYARAEVDSYLAAHRVEPIATRTRHR